MGNLLASLYTGNTGLDVNSVGVGVVGNNIANANTIGYKQSRAHFANLVSEFVVGTSGGASQLGVGAGLERIEKMFTQGSMQSTGVPTDLAISGDGFFVVRGTKGGVTQNFFTRAGSFRFDNDGYLVNQSGFRVQGFNADPQGVLGATLNDLRISKRNLDPKATGQVDVQANLRPDDPIIAGGFNVANTDGTSSYHASMVLYDSLGNAHQADLYGTHTGAGTWDMNLVLKGEDVAGGVAGNPVVVNLGQLTFDNAGLLQNSAIANPVNIAWNGANPGAVTFNLGDPTAAGGTGRAGTTQWNRVSQSSTSFLTQDGYGTGDLERVAIDEQGKITGGFTNGQTLVLGQVATARFSDATGLQGVGNNNYVETPESGQANIGAPQTGGRGVVFSGTLEQSNVELSDQFIDLIAYQRAYQANARTISTADNLLQEVFQLLR
jgi:flagellar hook protein FlgE